MSLLLRRREMSKKSKKLFIYDSGKILSGYSIAQAGFYGAGTAWSNVTEWFVLESDRILIKCFDNNRNSYGCAFVVAPAISREMMSEYSKVCIRAYTTYSGSSSEVNYIHVGVWTSSTPTNNNKVMVSTPNTLWTDYSFSTSSILSNSASEFYIGAGVCTSPTKQPGTVAIYVNKIWLE